MASSNVKEAVAQSFSLAGVEPVSALSEGFLLYKAFGSDGRVELMNGYAKKSDHKDLITIARYWAEQGKVVQVTTNPHFKSAAYKQVFGALNGTIYERKCPDLIVDGVFYEYESYQPPFKKDKISNMISKGVSQSPRIIINHNKGCSDRFVRRNILDRIRDKNFKYSIEEVWLYEKGKVKKLW